MGQINTSDLRKGMKVQLDKQPFTVVGTEFVKPGKGQAFNRIRLKHLLSGNVVEKTFKSGEKIETADVVEAKMRMLYQEPEGAIFMDDNSFDQVKVDYAHIGDTKNWLLEDTLYDIIFYNGQPVAVDPPTFMDLEIVETQPGARGDTASGRVMKPGVTKTGATVQIPIFIEQGERVKIDTRDGTYVSRSSEN